jgi:hypothetical protein
MAFPDRPRECQDLRQVWARPDGWWRMPGMEITASTADAMTVHVTRDEASIINNALNEVCNGTHLADFEFSARMGVSREEARKVLRTINDALKAQPRDNV